MYENDELQYILQYKVFIFVYILYIFFNYYFKLILEIELINDPKEVKKNTNYKVSYYITFYHIFTISFHKMR